MAEAARFGLTARRPVGLVSAAVVVAVLIVVVTTLVHGSRNPAREAALPIPHPPAPLGHVTVTQLAAYRWRSLPDAPIATRSEGVAAVWTGTRMIVWGGASVDGGVYGDGASYDPSTRSWQRLPASPLRPRSDPAYVWTGRQLFIWGGAVVGDKVVSDGATYDPSNRTWHRLPALPGGSHAQARAVWTGDRVVLFTATEGMRTTQVDVHVYNPDRDTWTTLAAIHITQTNLLDVSVLVGGDQLYAWLPVETIDRSGLRPGDDAFVYHSADNSWARTSLLPVQGPYSVGQALWTGDHVVFEPNGLECDCGGTPGESTGYWVDPRSDAVDALPARPSADSSTFTWTGSAILATGGSRIAGWDPATNRWSELARPPYQGGAVQVWTGTRLVIWGQLWALPSPDPDAGSPPAVAEPTGLDFAPSPSRSGQ
jgi:N-acetylneuraminic acid mutarotase